MKIIYYVHDLKFPIAEGYRREAWLLAKEAYKQGHDITIVSTSWKKSQAVKEGIKIRWGSPFRISQVKCDVLHYISQPSPLIVPLLLLAKTKKQIMTIFGGNLNSFWERPWDFFISFLVNKKIDCVTLQTDYQIELFKKTRLICPYRKIPPLFTKIKRTGKKDKKPTILYMSHFDESKGINEAIGAFLILRRKIKNLQLVIADSGLTKNKKIYEKIRRIAKGDIILKKVIDPAKALSKAWVYVYPLRTASETFSVPLSLVEAIQIGVPYVSTEVGGLKEYFDSRCLVKAADASALADKIEELIYRPIVYKTIKKIDHDDAAKKYMNLYT